MFRLARDEGDGLDAGGAGADHGNAKAAEIHAFLRPLPGVVDLAIERLQSLEVRQARRGQIAGRHHAVRRGDHFALLRGDCPAIGLCVEEGRVHPRVQLDVAHQVEALHDMIHVAQDLRLGAVALRPLPVLLQLVRERIGVLHALHIAAAAGIAVPEPRAADTAASFVHPHSEAQLAQAVERIEAGDAASDDDGVEVRGGLRGRGVYSVGDEFSHWRVRQV